MESIRFRLLGEVRVSPAHIGADRLIQSTMARALLVVLLTDGLNGVVPAHRMVDALWDDPPRSACSNLRTYKTRLQRELERLCLPDRITVGARGTGGYGVRAEPDEVDVIVFRSLVATARQRVQEGRPDLGAKLFADALALWRGRPGDDLPTTRRLTALTDLLSIERMDAVEGFSRAAVLSGRYQAAISILERTLPEQPTRESTWVLLACAHFASGNAALAQSAIRRACEALAHGVGLDPGKDLRAAERAAILHDADWFERYLLTTE